MVEEEKVVVEEEEEGGRRKREEKGGDVFEGGDVCHYRKPTEAGFITS